MTNEPHKSHDDDLNRCYVRGAMESLEAALDNLLERLSPNFTETGVRVMDLKDQVKRVKEGCDTEFMGLYR